LPDRRVAPAALVVDWDGGRLRAEGGARLRETITSAALARRLSAS